MYGTSTVVKVGGQTERVARPRPAILNGKVTLEGPRGHRTFEIRTQPEDAKFAPGRRIISLLKGPDNRCNYQRFGWVMDDGIEVWQKKMGGPRYVAHKPTSWEIFADMVEVLLGGLPSQYGKTYEGYTAHLSRRCLRCNLELTTPESIEAGIGPVCARKM